MNKLKKLFRWESSLILIFVLELVIFGTLNPNFLNFNTLLFSINDFVCICITALFLTFVIVTGGMDISLGSIIGLSSIIIGVTWKVLGVNIWLTIPIVIVVGALCGLLNGLLVAYIKVTPMVVTLGTSMLFSGLSLVVMGMSGASAYEGISGFPDSFVNIANGTTFKIPNPFIIFIVLLIIAYILLHRTKYGRYIFLCGMNQNSAEYSGINSKKIIMSTYILSGISAAIAGVVITSYLGGSRPDLGSDLTLSIVTAVVLGGTAITGGKGGVIGTAIASIVVGIMKFGLQMVGVDTQYISVGIGLLLILAIALRNMSFISKFAFKKKTTA